MAEIRFQGSIGKKVLSDEGFVSRVREQFLGEFKECLNVEIYDLSTQDEPEVLALVLEIPKVDRFVFRVDRQGFLDLAEVFSEMGRRGRLD